MISGPGSTPPPLVHPHVGAAKSSVVTLHVSRQLAMSTRWQGRPSAGSDFVDDFSGSITPSQERACSFRRWKLAHVAFFVNRLVLPEGNKATTRGSFYFVS